MNQKKKNLLLKDLCVRLPYELKVSYKGKIYKISTISICNETITIYGKTGYPMAVQIKDVKPYIFPLSSMTEEQKSYLHFNTKFRLDICNDLTVKIDEDDNYFYTDTSDYTTLIDWCNKNHFDYRGLIEKGLAIDATGLNIY